MRTSQTIKWIGLAIAVASFTLLGTVRPAHAATLALYPQQGPSPTSVTVTGFMFDGIGDVSFFVGGNPAGKATPDTSFSASIDLTITGPPGAVEVSACQADATGNTCGVAATAVFTLLAPTTSTLPPVSTSTTTTLPPSTTTTRPPTTTSQAATSTTRPSATTTPPTTTIATLPPITLPPETLTTTTIGGLIVPGPGEGGGDDAPTPDPDGSGRPGWLPWILGLGVAGLGVGWWRRRRPDTASGPVAGGFAKKGTLAADGIVGPQKEDGVFVQPDGTESRATFPKVDIELSASESGGSSGTPETNWKVEEGEKGATAGNVFPKVEIDTTAATRGKVFPKVEIDTTAATETPTPGTAEPDVLDLLDESNGD